MNVDMQILRASAVREPSKIRRDVVTRRYPPTFTYSL